MTIVVAEVLASGVAVAVNEIGPDRADTLQGISDDDLIGLRGSDNLSGGESRGVIVGGDERRGSGEGDRNLDGGPDNDWVAADAQDEAAADCERVAVGLGASNRLGETILDSSFGSVRFPN